MVKALQIGRSLVRSQLVSLEFFIDIKSFRSYYGPGVESASNRNEYQEHFLGLTTIPPSCAVAMKSGNLNFLEPSGSVQSCNGTAYQKIYCLSLIDIRSYSIRHGGVSRDKIHAILNVNVEIRQIVIIATKT